MRGSNVDYRLIRYNIDAFNLISLIFNNNIEYIRNKRIKIIKLVLLKFKILNVINYVLLVSRDNINNSNALS